MIKRGEIDHCDVKNEALARSPFKKEHLWTQSRLAINNDSRVIIKDFSTRLRIDSYLLFIVGIILGGRANGFRRESSVSQSYVSSKIGKLSHPYLGKLRSI